MVSERTHEVEDRLVHYVNRYDFAKQCLKDDVDTAWKFARMGQKENFYNAIARSRLWDGMCETYLDLARGEKCYVVDDEG